VSDHKEDDDEGEEHVERRGRPRKPPEDSRTEFVHLSFTPGEYRDLIHRAADADDGPLTVREWARRVLLNPASKP
jgi:hypothetical protein